MAELKALLFDVDGTLADTERDGHRVAFNLAFADAGLDWDWTVGVYGDLLQVTGGKERIQFFIDRYQPTLNIQGELKPFIASLHASKTRHYLDLLQRGGIPLRPGVERLLREARDAGLRLAIATTTTPENVTWLLRSTLGEQSLDWFELIAAGDIVPAKKPAPDIYRFALEHMRLQPDECLAFEDSENGIASSIGAGLRTIVTINGYTLDHRFDGALFVADSLGEPGLPMRVISGDALGAACVDLAMLNRLIS